LGLGAHHMQTLQLIYREGRARDDPAVPGTKVLASSRGVPWRAGSWPQPAAEDKGETPRAKTDDYARHRCTTRDSDFAVRGPGQRDRARPCIPNMQVALAWCSRSRGVTRRSSARASCDILEEAVGALDIKLDGAELKALADRTARTRVLGHRLNCRRLQLSRAGRR